ncbi:MAG TPA: hypothetical protein PKC18_01275 [Lacipirellulaceae bacterium]|nr:hypothetical protein [Lacipirellulaceae bacterium]HMP05734.1 hypothetical protein [Lacipirellulaceae bacterium]
MDPAGDLIRRAALAITFLVIFASRALAGGLLTETRYVDDFQGGPLVDGWRVLDDSTGSLEWHPLSGAATPYGFAVQSPYMHGVYPRPSDALIYVAFDIEPYDYIDWRDTSNNLTIQFTTMVDSVINENALSVVTRPRKTITGPGDEPRVEIAIPLSSIPGAPVAPCADPSHCGVGVRIYHEVDPSVAYPQGLHDFTFGNFVMDWSQESTLDPQLPAGWVAGGFGGTWAKQYYNYRTGTTRTFDGIAAFQDTSAPYAESASSQPQLIIDTWTPEFRFTNLAQAVLSIDLLAVANDNQTDALYIDLYRTSGPALPASNQPAIAELFTIDLSVLAQSSGQRTINILQDALNGEQPTEHVDGETVYRIRTRVYDGDLDLESFDFVHLRDFAMSHAELALRGDYNDDGVVDGDDLLTWQRTLGSPISVHVDGDGSGLVDAGDLPVWQSNFGTTRASLGSLSSMSANAPIPEPKAGMLLLAGLTGFAWRAAARRLARGGRPAAFSTGRHAIHYALAFRTRITP